MTIDLGEVSFIDSTGLRAIILIQQVATEHATPLAVIPPPAALLDLLEITGLPEHVVTNAVLHPTPGDDQPIELRISSYPDRVFVEVIDAGPGFDLDAIAERARKPERDGRGLMVVDRFCVV